MRTQILLNSLKMVNPCYQLLADMLILKDEIQGILVNHTSTAIGID